ncbi:hypothetical protein BGZ68_010424 [Mortierella alpina]|nr:hypothetical protein BGZ68_010424 [Mortierella alpina]
MSTSPTNSSKKRPRDESTETGTSDDRKQKRTSSATASQHSAQSSRDSSRSTHGKSSESKTGPTDRRHHARRTRRTDTEDTQEAPAAQSAEVLTSIQSQITTTNPSPAEQGHEEEAIGAQNMDEDHGEDDNPEDAAEQDQDAVAAHPPSEGEEEEINKGVVPDYVRREIEEFEQGFNGLQGRFKLLDKIGEGTFSSVYKAIDLEHDLYDNSDWDYDMDAPAESTNAGEMGLTLAKPTNAEGGKVVAIKRIYVTSSPVRIQNEIAILHDLSGHKNVVPLITAFRFKDQVIVVLPYFEHHDFRDYYEDLPMDDIRCYFRALLKALAHVHSHKIIHRDIKPSNFLFDLRRKTGLLVDFGLAERQENYPAKPRHTSAASRNASLNSRAPSKGSGSTAEHKVKSAQQNKENSVPVKLSEGTAAIAPPPGFGSSATTLTSAAHSAPASRDIMQRTAITTPVATVNATSISPLQRRSHVGSTATAPTQTPGTRSASSVTPRAQEGIASTSTAASVTHTGSYVQPRQRPNISNHDRSKPAGIVQGNATAVSNVQSTAPPASVAQSTSSLNYVRPPKVAGSATMPHPALVVGAREPGFLKKDLRPVMRVNRAGTRGFRAPEILFRHYRQTVAIDIWAVGVTLFSFLSGRFPFFHSNDDAEALLEIAVLFGYREMRRVAAKFNRTFVCNVPSIKELPISFARICRLLHRKRFGLPEDDQPKQEGDASTSASATAASVAEEAPVAPSLQPHAPRQSLASPTATAETSSQQQGVKQASGPTNTLVDVRDQSRKTPKDRLTLSHPPLADAPATNAEDESTITSTKASTDTVPIQTESTEGHGKHNGEDGKGGNGGGNSGNSSSKSKSSSKSSSNRSHSRSHSGNGSSKSSKKSNVGWDSQENLKSAVDLLLALALVLVIINVPPWLMFKGNTIVSVCAVGVQNQKWPAKGVNVAQARTDATEDRASQQQHPLHVDPAMNPVSQNSLQASITADTAPKDLDGTDAINPTTDDNVDSSDESSGLEKEINPVPQDALQPPSVPRRRVSNTYYASLSALPSTPEAIAQHQTVREALLALSGQVTIRHEFGADDDDVLNVISFKLEGDKDQLEAIAMLPGVIGIYPVRTRKRPKALPLGSLKLTRPSLESAHILTGIKMAQEQLGLTGKGIKVGIIGVDYKHPALGGCFGSGCKVAFGHDFVGDAYDNGSPEKDVPKPDKDPMDCAGHGTHVAGIVAARNEGPHALGLQRFVGVAPDATLGAYRVFGCDGEVGDDVLLAAMKAAYRDGMDIVNLSLGGSSSWPEEPFATACSAYIQKGMHIAIANGNDGEEGLFEDGAPATASGAVAVGSVDNTNFLGPAADLTWQTVDHNGQGIAAPGNNTVGRIGMAMGADSDDIPVKSFRTDITYVIHVPSKSVDPKGCAAFHDAEFEGENHVPRSHIIVLLLRGDCTFGDKAKNVVDAKLGGMLVYDTVPEQKPLGMAISGYNTSAAGLSLEDATLILDAVRSKQGDSTAMANTGFRLAARFTSADQVLKLASGGKISDFSSWGPDARLRYKPDIVTPGGMIYSTFPLAKGGFATLQGTSMASPYLAGIQALFLEKYGKTEPAKLLSILQSTAIPTIQPGSTTGLTSVFQQGGGLVSMERLFADDPPAILTPTVLYMNDTEHQKLDHEISFANPSASRTTRKWTVVHRPAVSVNGFDDSHHYVPVNQSRIRTSQLGVGAVIMTPPELVLAPGATGTATIHIAPPVGLALQERWLFSGYLEFQCQTDQGATCASSLVSYGGMHGSLAGIPILNPALNYPAIQLNRYADGDEGGTKAKKANADSEGKQTRQDHHDHHSQQQMELLPNAKHSGEGQEKEDGKSKARAHKSLYHDRSEQVTVGKNDDDWLQILISVNFPTGLLTIEAESVCDDDQGHLDDGNSKIRLEVGGSGPSRFQIMTKEELDETKDVVAPEEEIEDLQGDEHLERIALLKARRERSQELAFMPSGLYMPYKGYSRVMMAPSTLDEVVRLHRKTEDNNQEEGKDKEQVLHRGSKTPRGGKKGDHKKGERKAKTHRHEHKHEHKRLRTPGEEDNDKDKIQGQPATACVPRILGLIPNGFNPWTTRNDDAEGNTFQSIPWTGDLLLQNHEAVAEEDYDGPASPNGHAAGESKEIEKDVDARDKRNHRKSTSTKMDLTQESRNLPSGRYRLVVKALKPWGIHGRASDVERWSSPIIVIKRKK